MLPGRAALAACALCGAVAAWAQVSPPTDGAAAPVPVPSAQASSSHGTQASDAAKPAQATASVKHGVRTSHYHPDRFAGRAGTHYRLVWGVDDLLVKWGESGELVRFGYRVLDADKAKVLNDKRNEPSLIDPRAGVKLVVPSMENVGQLRQSTPPENGKSYWIVFSNKGRLVRRGDHVNVVIGTFHADGLVVD